MKSEEIHPILKDIHLTVLHNVISEKLFLTEQNIAINTDKNYIGRVANCVQVVEITFLDNSNKY